MKNYIRLCACALILSAMLAMPAAAAWFEARSSHFIVYSNDSESNVRDFAARLERFDIGMRKLRNLPENPDDRVNPLIVYVVPNTSMVQKLCATSTRRCPNVAGFYHGRVGGSIAFTPKSTGAGSLFDLNAQTVLFHEYSHHFMLENYSAVYPAWFVEGFAEFNSTADFKDTAISFGKPANHRAYGLFRGEPISMAELMTSSVWAMKPERRDALYGRGWLLTHYLTFNEKRRGQLAQYLEVINGGKPSLEAAKLAFGDLKILNRELDNYVHAKMRYVTLPLDPLSANAIVIRPLTAGEAAVMPVRWQSSSGVDHAEAQVVVEQARKLASPFPSDPGAQLALAEAEYDSGNDDRTESAADRVLAVVPKDRKGLLYKGRVHIRRAKNAGATKSDVWNEARSWYIRANHNEPDAAEPLLLFYTSFIAQSVKPTPSAILGLRRAFAIAPQDDNLRILLAIQLIRDEQYKDARRVLAPLAFDPHTSPDNPAAQLVAMIDRQDTGGLNSLVDQLMKMDESKQPAPER